MSLGSSCALLPADHLRLFSLVRSRKEHRGIDLISDGHAIRSHVVRGAGRSQQTPGYAKFHTRSHNAGIGVYG